MRGLLVALMIAACALPLCAQGRLLEAQFVASIEAQDLSSAVLVLSRQAGVQVVMPADKLDRYATAGLQGRMSLRQALAQLLKATPYRFRQSGESTIIIDAESAGVAH